VRNPLREPFVPLGGSAATPTPAAFQALRVTGVSSAEAAQPVGPAVSQEAGPVLMEPAAASPGAEPKITVHRDGERVTRISIECSCGQIIELACAY
jgi:hypothetical protein